ncbi:MAG TPA: response regulator [Verrucomicrobiae bacterium]|jgi:signal transduction histidine kinase
MAETTPLIFIVDDDRGMLRLIEKTLQREGFAIVTAASARDALGWLRSNRPALMLLDLKLQDMEGKEVINHLADLGMSIPFIVITGQGDERVAVEMMKRGALDYLVKDVQFHEFVPTVVRRALDQLDRDRRLAAAEQERKRLEQQIFEIGERERRRIGQDLHDGLGQHLAGMELMMQALEQNVASVSKSSAAQIGKISEHLREAIRQSKALARGVSPVELQANGLMSALEELATSAASMFRVDCTFRCPSPVLISDNVIATHLFRIAQEAATNAVKHGRARHIGIELGRKGGQLLLTVRDDGKGFDAKSQRHKGMGLSGMNYRAQMIGGSLIVEPQKGGGTIVTCSAPGSVIDPVSK